MEKQPEQRMNNDRERDLVFLRDMHECDIVADSLGMKGKGLARYCPQCHNAREPRSAGVPTLKLSTRFFECSNCEFRGDVVQLVLGVRNCSIDEAIKFLTELGMKRKLAARNRERADAEFNAIQAQLKSCQTEQERAMLARKAFLTQCQPLGEEDLTSLRGTGISAEVASHFRLRVPPTNLTHAFQRLLAAFGRQTMLLSGLSEEETLANGEREHRLRFEVYHREGVPYLIVPYFDAGQPAFIRAIPTVPSDQRPRKDMPLCLGTAVMPPCPFNADALTQAGTLFIFRREIEAMHATAAGYSAIATSFTHFPKYITQGLAGREVHIVAIANAETEAKLAIIDAAFISGRVPPPKRLFRQEWEPISEVLAKEVDQADTAMITYEFKSERISVLSELEKAEPAIAPIEAEPADEAPKAWSPLAFVTDLLPEFVKKRGRPAAPPCNAKPKTDVPAVPADRPTVPDLASLSTEGGDATHAPLQSRPARPVK